MQKVSVKVLCLLLLCFISCLTISCIATPSKKISQTPAAKAPKHLQPIYYPALEGHKICSPNYYGLSGCFLGLISKGGFYVPKQDRMATIKSTIEKFEREAGFLPAIYTIGCKLIKRSQQNTGFPIKEASYLAQKGIIPFVTYDLCARHGFSESSNYHMDEILEGFADGHIRKFASTARQYGRNYGGFFIRILDEINLCKWWRWSGRGDYCSREKLKKVWIHVWKIFEEEGANEFATWVWHANVEDFLTENFARNANEFYPGDEYVDWIGISGWNYAKTQSWSRWEWFEEVFREGYTVMRKTHPTKPLLINEMGSCGNDGKDKWTKNAFETIKKSYPGIKGVLWCSVVWSLGIAKNCDGRIDTSSRAFTAFIHGASDRFFLKSVGKPFWIFKNARNSS